MKRKALTSRLMLLLTALLIPLFTFAQADTLYITHSATTYLLFAEEVLLVDIGKSNEYLSRIEGRCVFVKASKEHTAPTSILVQHGDQYLVAVLAYKPASSRFLYDYRETTLPGKDLQKDNKDERGAVKEEVSQHFNAFQQSPQGVKRKRVSRQQLQLSLTHLANDQEATYLRFTLQNCSSIDYVIDVVTFERKEKKGKRFSVNNVNRKFIEPVLTWAPERIEALHKDTLQYAIPLYALGKRSHLKVNLREKNGSRLLTLKLPARYINQAFVYQP